MKKSKSWIIGLATICFTETFTHGLVFSTFTTLLLQDSYFFHHTQESFRYFFFGCVLAATPLVRLVVTPIIGKSSLPKKYLLVLCAGFNAVGYLLLFVSYWYSSLIGLLLARGCIGIFSASWTISNVYIQAKVEDSKRAIYFSILHAASHCGILLGFFTSSLLLVYGYTSPFICAMFAAIICLLLSLFLLPQEEVNIYRSQEPCTKKNTSLILCFAHLLFRLGWSSYWDLMGVLWLSFFTLQAAQISLFYAYASLCALCVNLLLLPPLFRKYKPIHILEIALGSLIILMPCMYYAHSPSFLWTLIPLQQLSFSAVIPTLSTLISSLASPGTEDKALGNQQSAEAIGLCTSPLISSIVLSLHICAPIFFGSLAIGLSYCIVQTAKSTLAQ